MTEPRPVRPEGRGAAFLLVGPLPPPATGQSVSFDMLQRELRRRGSSCRVIDLSRGDWNAGGGSGLRRALQMTLAIARFAAGLLAGYRSVYLTIAQSRSGFVRDAIMIWLAVAVRGRVVVHLKGGNYDGFYAAQPAWLRAIIRATLRRVERILVLGQGLVRMYDFEPRVGSRVGVVPNGLPEDFAGMSKRAPANELRVLFLSNLIESKGYFDVLEALGRLSRAGVPFRARFAGEFVRSVDDVSVRSAEEARARFEAHIDELGLADRVEYLGAVSGSRKWDLLAESHVFLLPTRYVNEGQPVSIIEAMAYGCPVITTRYRAIPDLVVEGETGHFVEYGDAAGIAARLRALASDPEAYEAMSEAAVARFRRQFTMEAHLERIVPLIERSAYAAAGRANGESW